MSFSFGSTSTPVAGGFGSTIAPAPAATTTVFSFGGAPAAAGASTATSAAPGVSGFSFGSAPAQAAAPAAASTSGAFSFGAAPIASAGTSFSLGGAAGGAGAKPTGVAAPLSFGTPAATTSTAPAATGFSLGTPKPTLSLGTAATTAASGVSFGSTAAATTAGTTGFSGFGLGGGTGAAATTQAGAGSIPASTGFSLGAVKPTLSLGSTTATAPGGLSYGSATAVTTTSTAGFSGFGLGGSSAATTAQAGVAAAPVKATVGLGGTASAPSVTPSTGLGGLANPLVLGTAAGTAGQQAIPANTKTGEAKPADTKHVKEVVMPNELAQTVEDFKKHVKEERAVSSDIAHISTKVHQKIKANTEGLLNLLQGLGAALAKNKAQLDALKRDAAQELVNVEIAQRTKNTPPAMQYENIAPYEYFSHLVVKFENQMLLYRRQIEETEQHLQTMATHQALNPDDITKAIEKIHGTFTNLAGKFQKLHELSQHQKDLYMHFHRLKYGRNPDIAYETMNSKPAIAAQSPVKPAVTIGPSPFTGQQDLIAMARASLSASSRGPQQPVLNPVAGAGPLPTYGVGMAGATTNSFFSQQQSISSGTGQPGLLGSTLSPFQSSFSQNQPTPFSLTTGKRGKF